MSYLSSAKEHLLPFFDGLSASTVRKGPWKYHRHMVRPWGLIPTALVIQSLDHLGELQQLKGADRVALVELLQSSQDPADGYFKDPLLNEEDRRGDHSWEDIWGQMLKVSNVLALLGSSPKYPVPSSSFMKAEGADPKAFMESLDWRNPWHHGERVYRCINSYMVNHPEVLSAPMEDPFLAGVLDFLTKHIFDSQSGYPIKGGCSDMDVAMAGAFKLSMVWMVLGLEVPFAEAIIDTTLSHQSDEGSFFKPHSNMCINWDSVWLLRELDVQLDSCYRSQDIERAHVKLVNYLNRFHLKADGGYSFERDHAQNNHHSIHLSEGCHRVGDMLGTRMVLFCLQYADEACGHLGGQRETYIKKGQVSS